MSEEEELTIDEELRWVYVLKHKGKLWQVYNTKDQALAAMTRIKLNEQWARARNKEEDERKKGEV